MKAPFEKTVFRPGLFFPHLDLRSKDALFGTLVDAMTKEGVAHEREALLKSILDREAVGPTGVGHGVAIPRARSIAVESTAVVFATLHQGLDFGAPDGIPVRMIFLIVAPYGIGGALFFPLLGVIARAINNEAERQRLYDAESFDEFEMLVRQAVRTPLLETLSL